jgi:hypothetical protein
VWNCVLINVARPSLMVPVKSSGFYVSLGNARSYIGILFISMIKYHFWNVWPSWRRHNILANVTNSTPNDTEPRDRTREHPSNLACKLHVWV